MSLAWGVLCRLDHNVFNVLPNRNSNDVAFPCKEVSMQSHTVFFFAPSILAFLMISLNMHLYQYPERG